MSLLKKRGESIKKLIIFFFLFLIIFTFPVPILLIGSHINSERIANEIKDGLNTYFIENCRRPISINNVWIERQDFWIGGDNLVYGFKYKNNGVLDEYTDSAVYLSPEFFNEFNCSTSSRGLVYDDSLNQFVEEIPGHNINKIKVEILGDFKRLLLISYGYLILIVDLFIILVWGVVILFKWYRRRN